MSQRDDFSENTKRYLALRAGHRCSFTGCTQATVGPGDESPTAITNIGQAAHICAASPGGKRYVGSMTSEERSHISNGIWLCANHAALIDRDEAIYTVDTLRKMKAKHEATCAESVRNVAPQLEGLDLCAIGPHIVVLGSLREIRASEWVIDVQHFVRGDLKLLTDLISSFDHMPSGERYLVVNSLGDGRLLDAPPSVLNGSGTLQLRCPVAPRFPRTSAHELGSQWATSTETNDLFLEHGHIARVSGVASLPQVIRQSLSLQKGESPFHPDFGTRIAEYYDALRESLWLARFIKLEIVKQSAIPYFDSVTNRAYTPLHCIERVWDIVIGAETEKRRLPIRLDCDVNGVGRWEREVSVFVEHHNKSGKRGDAGNIQSIG